MTTTGICNNRLIPLQGASYTPYSRLLDAAYDDGCTVLANNTNKSTHNITAFLSLLGVFTMRKSVVSNRDLPSPRQIGNVALQHSVYNPPLKRLPNHGSLLFGQYITHDFGFKDAFQDCMYILVFTIIILNTVLIIYIIYDKDNGNDGLRCCSKNNKRALPDQLAYYGCQAMEVPRDDPFYSQFGGGCLDYIRSQPVFGNDCQMGPAQIVSS